MQIPLIASDVYSRYKNITKGLMCCTLAGYDSFGLPAEQYAI
jgi:leucyl-tRNA synthetase